MIFCADNSSANPEKKNSSQKGMRTEERLKCIATFVRLWISTCMLITAWQLQKGKVLCISTEGKVLGVACRFTRLFSFRWTKLFCSTASRRYFFDDI